MRWIAAYIALCIVAVSNAQPLPDRYRTEIFDNFIETENILFSQDVPQPTPGGGFYEWITGLPLNADETDTDPVDLYLDVFEPVGDTLTTRPAIVICFGGGFLTGSTEHWSIVALAQKLAKRGYVTVTPDYRLGMNIFDQDLAARSVYRAVQDGRAAVKYLRANADSLGIDPNEIYIGGHSAGAFIALHNLYMDTEEERPLPTFVWTQDGDTIPDLECLDCTGIAEGSGHANSAFSLAGAIGFLSYIDTSTDGRTTMFHSQDDGTVPYDSGEPFGDVSGLVLGSDLPTVYGSLPISLRCDTISLPDTLHSYTNRGHGVHEAPGDTLYADIVPRISDWFYDQRLKPEEYAIEGPVVVCPDDNPALYSIEAGDAVYFDWQVTGGTFIEQSPDSNTVLVEWSDTASSKILELTPYNQFLARGITQQIEISLAGQSPNMWIAGSGNWSTPANWSLGHRPVPCEEVSIVNFSPTINVAISPGSVITVLSVNLEGNVGLDVGAAALLYVKQ